MAADWEESFDRLSGQVRSAISAGQFDQALAILDEQLRLAREQGDQVHIDRSTCNRAGILVERGGTAEVKQPLREILLRNADPKTCFLASSTLSRAYELTADLEKALFYAELTKRYAHELATAEHLSSSLTRWGGLLVAAGRFDEAEEHLQRAIQTLPADSLLRRAAALDNLGYCFIVRGRLRKGFSLLFQSLRLYRRLGATGYEMNPRLSLAHAYLQIDRFDRALHHARQSLRASEEAGYELGVRYSLFVLGEAEKQSGQLLAARYYFERLQREFYPQAPGVPDLLLLFNVRNMVNIKAIG